MILNLVSVLDFTIRIRNMSQVLTLKSSLPNLGGQPRSYTSQEWEAHRSEIKRLYADQNIPLKDVIQIMKTGCSFFATYVLTQGLRGA